MGTHSIVLPQSLGVFTEFRREIKTRHILHTQNIVHLEPVLTVDKLHGGHQVAHGGPMVSMAFRLFFLPQIIFILFLERGKGREKERERNIDV